MKVYYKPSFIRQYKLLEPALQQELKEKISLFKKRSNHRLLKVHKLKGPLSGKYSFSVNYRYRVVFVYGRADTAVLLLIGDHAVYQ